MRCLTLANTLRRQGVKPQFISRLHKGNLTELLVERGHRVARLPVPEKNVRNNESAPYERWLGADWLTDAQQTLGALNESSIDILIIDHYGVDTRWESFFRPLARKIMVIDDLAVTTRFWSTNNVATQGKEQEFKKRI